MGNPFSSSKPVQGDVKVWGPQEPYLKYSFGQAKDIYQKQQGTPWYQGDLYAGIDPNTLKQIMGNASTFANTVANPATSQLAGIGSNFLGLANGGTLSSLMADLNDPNGALNSGNSYAHSDVANGLVDAANRDVTRALTENDLPQTRLAAIGSGNTNSSREGAREAILQRGAEDRMSDLASQIRGQLFNTGVDQFNTSVGNRANAINELASLGLGSYGAAGDLQNQGQQGLYASANVDQANRQGALDAGLQQWTGQDTRASDLLSRLFGIVGGNIGQSPGMANKQSTGWFSALFPGGLFGGG